MLLYRLAWRSLGRNKLRTSFTVVSSVLVLLCFAMLRTVSLTWGRSVEEASEDRLITRDRVSPENSLPLRYVERTKQVPGVTKVTYVSWFGGKIGPKPKEVFTSLAAEPSTFLEVEDELKLSAEDKARWLADKRGALVGDDLARTLGVKVGDRIHLVDGACPGDWDLTVDAIYTTKFRSSGRRMLVFPWEHFNEKCPAEQKDQIGWLEIRVDDVSRAAQAASAIDTAFAQESQQTVTMSERASNVSFLASLSFVLRALNFVAGLNLVILAMIIGNTLSSSLRERSRELSTLKAIGFGSSALGRLVALEGGFIGFVVGTVAIAASYPIVELALGSWLQKRLRAFFPSFEIENSTYAWIFGFAIGSALAASIVLSLLAARRSIVTGLRQTV